MRAYLLRVTDGQLLSAKEQRHLKGWLVNNRISDVWTRRYGGQWDAFLAFAKRSARSYRNRLWWVLIVLLAFLALSTFGLTKWRESAQDALRSSQDALRSSRVGALAVAARARVAATAGDARMAALLSRAALPSMLSAGEPGYVPQAESALADALVRPLEIMRFIGHTDAVYSAAFAPDGRRIVSASADKTLRFWEPMPFEQSLSELVAKADALCPLADAERKAQGLFDPMFPHPARKWTSAQMQPCGLNPAMGSPG